MSDKIAVNRCWKCNARLLDHQQMNSIEMMLVTPPIAGDLSMCGGCGSFSEFDGNGQLHKPSLERMREIVNTPALMDMQARLIKRPDGLADPVTHWCQTCIREKTYPHRNCGNHPPCDCDECYPMDSPMSRLSL